MKHTQPRLYLHRYNNLLESAGNSHHRQYKEGNTGNVILNIKNSCVTK